MSLLDEARSKVVLKGGKGSSADKPLPSSSISGALGERFKLGFGNDAGKVDYLKKKSGIEDAKINERGELVVKEGGQWKRVNAPGLDLGDVANLVGHSVVPIVGGLYAMAGAVGGPAGSTGMAVLGGSTGESIRKIIGAGMGTDKPKDALDSAKSIAAEGLISGMAEGLAQGAGLAYKYMRPGAIKVFANTIEKTANIPAEYTEYAIAHPDVLRTVGDVKLPSGKIYAATKAINKTIDDAVRVAGKEIQEAVANAPKLTTFTLSDGTKATIKEGLIDLTPFSESAEIKSGIEASAKNAGKVVEAVGEGVKKIGEQVATDAPMFPYKAIKDQFLLDVAGQIKKWGGVDRFTAADKALHAKIITALDDPEGRLGNQLTFQKLHNLKELIYENVKYAKNEGGRSYDAPGEILSKNIAKGWNGMLRDKSEAYKVANDTFKKYAPVIENLNNTKSFIRDTNANLTSAVKGTISEQKAEGLKQLDDIYKTATNGKSFMPMVDREAAKFQKETAIKKAFSRSPDPTTATAGLSLAGSSLAGGIASGNAGMTLPATIGALLTAASSPKAVKLGIQGATLASKLGKLPPELLKKLTLQAIPRAVRGM
jgi:hypothetical protein